jgi:hypothetical protein
VGCDVFVALLAVAEIVVASGTGFEDDALSCSTAL